MTEFQKKESETDSVLRISLPQDPRQNDGIGRMNTSIHPPEANMSTMTVQQCNPFPQPLRT